MSSEKKIINHFRNNNNSYISSSALYHIYHIFWGVWLVVIEILFQCHLTCKKIKLFGRNCNFFDSCMKITCMSNKIIQNKLSVCEPVKKQDKKTGVIHHMCYKK